MQLPAHGGIAKRAVDPPCGKTDRAFQAERSKRAFQQARRAHRRIGKIKLRLVALGEHRAADAVRVGQQARGQENISRAVLVDRGQRQFAAGAQRNSRRGLHADAAVQPLKRFKIVIFAVQLIEILGNGLHFLQVAVHLGIGHIMRIAFNGIELLCAEEVPVKEIVKAIGQEHAAAGFCKRTDRIPQCIRIRGVHDTFIRVKNVKSIKRKALGNVHHFRCHAEQQRLAQA